METNEQVWAWEAMTPSVDGCLMEGIKATRLNVQDSDNDIMLDDMSMPVKGGKY